MKEGSSWEADSSSASHEIPLILLNPVVYERTQKSPPLVLIVSHINPGHTLP